MDAELSRMMGQTFNSPYFRVYGPFWNSPEGGDLEEISKQLIAIAVDANSFDNLPEDMQQFLQACIRTNEILDEMGNPPGDRATIDAQVIERLDEEEDG